MGVQVEGKSCTDIGRVLVLNDTHARGSCAIVGNSGLLRLSTFGRSIDSHDTVVRVNQAPLRGYSRRVGLKAGHCTTAVMTKYIKVL
jgi:hypothetical protein